MGRSLLSIFVSGFLLLSSMAFAKEYGVFENHAYEFVIKKSVSQFSETYTISSPSNATTAYPPTYPGKVKKSMFRIQPSYDLSDQKGWQATGSIRLASLGLMYLWATDIDIYDTRGVKIGFIDGSIATLEAARYDLYGYDEQGKSKLVGVALADAEFTHFSITTPDDYLPIAELVRDVQAHYWRVTVTQPHVIDDRIIRIFAGFVISYEDKFLVKDDITIP